RRTELGEYRGVPGAADDCDPLPPLLDRAPDRLAHERLAKGVLAPERVRMPVAKGAHRFQQAVEQSGRILAALDLVLPPELAVGKAGRRRQRADGVDARDVIVVFFDRSLAF